MEKAFLTKTNELAQSDQIREILEENHIHFTAKKIGLDDDGVIDFNKAVQTIHITEFYVEPEHLKMAKELILQVKKSKGKSLYLKSYCFRSIFFALVWLFGISSLYALYLGIKGFRTENKWLASLGILISLVGIFYTVQHFVLPRIPMG